MSQARPSDRAGEPIKGMREEAAGGRSRGDSHAALCSLRRCCCCADTKIVDKLEANVTFQVKEAAKRTLLAAAVARGTRRRASMRGRRSAESQRGANAMQARTAWTSRLVLCRLCSPCAVRCSAAASLRCAQIKNNSYDSESNRELLKLYSVSPDMVKPEILSRLLLKCLMELPSPEFQTALYLLPSPLHSLESVKFLCKLHALLDTCAFKKFWSEVAAWRAVQANAAQVNFAEVPSFDAAIRKFITVTIAATYSTITSASLRELWNIQTADKKGFEEAVAAAGWTMAEEGKAVVIRATPGAASKDNAGAQRSEQPTMEQLAKLITAQ